HRIQRTVRSSLPHHTPPPPLSTLPLHDALPISRRSRRRLRSRCGESAWTCSSPATRRAARTGTRVASSSSCATVPAWRASTSPRSEEHTSELQSRVELVCRLLLEKKKITDRRSL